jgi:hypothetical protein
MRSAKIAVTIDQGTLDCVAGADHGAESMIDRNEKDSAAAFLSSIAYKEQPQVRSLPQTEIRKVLQNEVSYTRVSPECFFKVISLVL